MNTSSSWALYNAAFADNDVTEKDLFFCINSNANYDKFISMCGMDEGDVPQPIIKLRGNRAYLCHWMTHPNTKQYKELETLGIREDTDLFEAAGCLLRLAMWPTDKLFDLLEERSRDVYKATRTDTDVNANSAGAKGAFNNGSSDSYQIAAHFRCGDVAFGRIDSERVCKFYPGDTEDGAMAKGTPPEFGQCIQQIIRERYTLHSLYIENKKLSDELVSMTSRLKLPVPVTVDHAREAEVLSLPVRVLISSDSQASAFQIKSTIDWTLPVANESSLGILPKGCHIQFDKSVDCFKDTTAQWLLLSFSNVIITQSEINKTPSSAYSRYAAIYGLTKNVIKDGRSCMSTVPQHKLGRLKQGNWWCGND